MTSIINDKANDIEEEDSSSDDELDIFSKLNAMAVKAGENARKKHNNSDDEEEEKYEKYFKLVEDEFQQLESLLVLPYLCKQLPLHNTSLKESLPKNYQTEIEEVRMLIQNFIDGKYLDIITSEFIFDNIFNAKNQIVMLKKRNVSDEELKEEEEEEEEEKEKANKNTNEVTIDKRDIYRSSISLRTRCIEFISNNITNSIVDEENQLTDQEINFYRAIRTFKIILAGAASLNLFVQANWTGPPVLLSDTSVSKNEERNKILWLLPIVPSSNNIKMNESSKLFSHLNNARAAVRMALETEGFSSYPHCEVPECLIAARTIFNLLDATAKDKKSGLKWCDRDPITLGISESIEDGKILTIIQTASRLFKTIPWWNARTTVAHHRTLSTGIEGCEAFKRNAKEEYEMAIRLHPFLDKDRNMVKNSQATICAQLHLEWGLAQHYWNETNGAKTSIRQAQTITGLSASVSGAVGVRGKWSKETAQMVLLAESNTASDHNGFVGMNSQSIIKDNNKNVHNTDENNNIDGDGCVNNRGDDDKNGQNNGDIVGAVKTAKVKEILLEEIDPDTPLLERIKFTSKSPYKNDLSLIDQAIVLGLCVDVSNQNPKHGLTNEQMSAYIARVMVVESTRNWMVYTTSLITKSFVEYERWKTKERSVLQLQALVDQHTNRISAGQMPTTDINAPANERMAIIYGLVMPPLFEMKKQLADRYMGIYVKRSALELYRELELWEDVVQCLLDTKQDDEALSLVATQLEKKPSPMLWCCLGELEDNDDHFKTAWKISNQRYARSMRLLGKRLFHRGQYEESIECYLASLAVRPQEHHAWWRVGTASMRIEKWNMALRAWTHCARIEPKDGEAWGNMGAVYCRLNQLDEAYNAFDQGLKQQRQNWKMWENFMLLSLRTRRYGRALYGQEQLLNLRHKRSEKGKKDESASAVDLETINILTNVVTTSLDCKRDPSIIDTLDEISKEKIFDNFNTPASFHAPRLRRLFETIERTISASPPIWALYGQLCCAMGDMIKARECCAIELKMLKNVEDWEKDEEFCMNITRTTLRLVELANMKVGDEKLDEEAQENAKMVLKSSIKGLEKFYKDSEMMKLLKGGDVA